MLLSQEYRSDWNATTKITFRFIFSYVMLYIILMFLSSSLESVIVSIGKGLLGINYEFVANGRGSGDTTFAYVTLFINLVGALIIGTIWSILDRKRPAYNKLFYWFLVIVRIYLVLFMFFYGFVKVFKVQFPSPSLMRLLQPLGDFSPMGLAWTYMGYSKGFNLFAGGMEVLGGLLLIPRRTQTLGALVVMGVMLQVAVMNFMFDIPVKIFSVHLILFAAIIFMTDARRFINVFITNKETRTYQYYNPIDDKLYHKVIFWLKIGLTVLIFAGLSWQMHETEKSRGDLREKPALYGIWEAHTFIKNNDTLPPLITDEKRWRYLVVDFKDRASAKMMNGGVTSFNFEIDTTSKKLTIDNREDGHYFSYERKGKNALILDGSFYYDSLKIHFVRKDHKFELRNRGFHWINEYPRNK
ncbi:DoxX family protein [Spongiivirga citrea]|uniref:DoxX family protein n=1 Tax=Spongiivirga citrea TaxID=1481457 RepID=A0A6M0CS05_9FLAO|nr:DoxX family protein [Spongiivirga citrea]NER18884.1 hypothetical protein [Spongiivirga citrea]